MKEKNTNLSRRTFLAAGSVIISSSVLFADAKATPSENTASETEAANNTFEYYLWKGNLTFCKAFFAIFLCLMMINAANAQEKIISINYSKIVDSSPITHSGIPVGGILRKINELKTSQVDTKQLKALKADVTKITQEVKNKQKEANETINILAQRVAAGYDTLETAKKNALSWLNYVDEAKQNLYFAKLKLNAYTQQFSEDSHSLQNLQTQVEPFLEPYGFLLEDALETSLPNQRRLDLIDIGDLFPEGEAQPAWADLVRTRRYFVLSNGKDYARIFIPGDVSQTAYQQNYKVLRHILGWLWDSSKTEWSIDAYAYQNDLTTQILKLNTTPHQIKINSIPPPPANTVPLDLQAIKEFLDKKLTLEGAYLNNQGTLVPYGSKANDDPTLEGQPIELSDLAVAYRAVYYAGLGDAYISLDPSPYPEQVNVNFGGRLADTRMGWVVLRSDMCFKTLSEGFDPVTGDSLTIKLRNALPDFKTVTERENTSSEEIPKLEYTRFWFHPNSVGIFSNPVNKIMKISSSRFTGQAVREDPELGDTTVSSELTPSWTKDTLAHLNNNYDGYAKLFPELHELDNVGKLLVLFHWLKQQKTNLDLDSLLDVNLPKFSTPRRKPQMIVGYNAIDNRFISENLSDFSEKWTSKRAYDDNDRIGALFALPKTSIEVLNIIKSSPNRIGGSIGGGIDLNLAKAIAKPKPIKPTDLAVYQKLKLSPTGEVKLPNKTIQRAMVKPVIEIKQETPSGITHTVSEPKPIGNTTAKSRQIANTNEEIIEIASSTGKVKSLRRGSENSLSEDNSRIAYYGDDNVSIAYAHYEKGTEQTYKFRVNDNLLTAEKTSTSKIADEVTGINNSLRRNDSTSQAWKNLSENTEILAFDKLSDNQTVILKKEGDSYRLTRYDEQGKEVVSFDGNAAIAEMDKISRLRVENGSTNSDSFIHASEDGDKFVLIVGKKRKEMSISEIEDLMNNPSRTERSDIDELFDSPENSQQNFIIYRDALTRRPKRFGSSLREGGSTDPIQLIRLFRERYQGKRFLLDDETELAKKNLAAIQPIKSPGDVGLLIPEKSFPITDFGLIRRIKTNLAASGIVLIDTPQQMKPIPNVLIVSGHNDKALVDYLTNLGEQGLLEDKVILINTCYADGNPDLFHDLIYRYKPKGMFLYTQKISDVALDPVLKNLGQMLKEMEAKGETIHPADLYEKAINRTLMDTSLSKQQLDLVRKLRPSLLQVSYIKPLNVTTSGE